MTKPLVQWLLRLAAVLLPPRYKAWGVAMSAELDGAEPSSAPAFAVGCVLAAGRVRLQDAGTLSAAARLALAVFAVIIASVHLRWAWSGVLALWCGRDADVLVQLRQTADAGRSLHAYLGLRGPAVAMLISLAASHVAVAASLARWDLRAFLPSYSAAVASALALASLVVLCGMPIGFLAAGAAVLGAEAALVLLVELYGTARS